MIKFLGDVTRYVNGVPARYLTAEEWAALTDDQRATCLAEGLYDAPKTQAKGDK